MKQTAMQMAIDHYKKLSEQGSNQAYVVAKFLEENFLAMEKEQSQKMYEYAAWAMFYNGHGQTFEEYWNKNFKSE